MAKILYSSVIIPGRQSYSGRIFHGKSQLTTPRKHSHSKTARRMLDRDLRRQVRDSCVATTAGIGPGRRQSTIIYSAAQWPPAPFGSSQSPPSIMDAKRFLLDTPPPPPTLQSSHRCAPGKSVNQSFSLLQEKKNTSHHSKQVTVPRGSPDSLTHRFPQNRLQKQIQNNPDQKSPTHTQLVVVFDTGVPNRPELSVLLLPST